VVVDTAVMAVTARGLLTLRLAMVVMDMEVDMAAVMEVATAAAMEVMAVVMVRFIKAIKIVQF
jgi:hypothetical protein